MEKIEKIIKIGQKMFEIHPPDPKNGDAAVYGMNGVAKSSKIALLEVQ